MAIKLKDLYSIFNNPSGGSSTKIDFTRPNVSGFGIPAPSLNDYTKPVVSGNSYMPAQNSNIVIPNGPMSVAPAGSIRPGVAPVTPPQVASKPATVVAPTKPLFSGAPATTPAPTGATGTNAPVPSSWIKPDGTFYTPQEIAANASRAYLTAHGKGDVPTAALNQFGGNGKSAVQLQADAAGLNNAANDIAVGENDPYNVAGNSGSAYTPQELDAIQSSYAGIYKPAINTALAKVSAKQASDKADADHKADLDKIQTQFKYDKLLKQTPGATASADISTYLPGGAYVPGANPVVDAWAQRVFNQEAKIGDIKDATLRNAVTVAVQQGGNDLAGKPTTTELGRSSASAAAALLKKLNDGTGTSVVGTSRLFNGGLAIPGTDAANFKIDFDNLKSMLSLDGVKYLKGQGSVSDAERALLASAVTKLNLSQSEDEFKNTLNGIISKLNGADASAGASTASNIVSAPDGTQIQITD